MIKFQKIVFIIGAIIFGIVSTSCFSDETKDVSNLDHGVTGRVVTVKALSLTKIDLLTIEDGLGKLWEFSGRSYLGVGPSHLRQHMLEGKQVVVTYQNLDGVLHVINIMDYISGGNTLEHD